MLHDSDHAHPQHLWKSPQSAHLSGVENKETLCQNTWRVFKGIPFKFTISRVKLVRSQASLAKRRSPTTILCFCLWVTNQRSETVLGTRGFTVGLVLFLHLGTGGRVKTSVAMPIGAVGPMAQRSLAYQPAVIQAEDQACTELSFPSVSSTSCQGSKGSWTGWGVEGWMSPRMEQNGSRELNWLQNSKYSQAWQFWCC